MIGNVKSSLDRGKPVRAFKVVRELVVVIWRQRQTPEHIQRFVENILF